MRVVEVRLMKFFINSPITSLNVYGVKSPKGKRIKVNGRVFNSITYRKEGTVKLNFADKTLVSHPGCITFTPKHTDYSTEILNDTHMIAIHFDYPCENGDAQPFVYENTNHIMCNLFDEIYEKYSAEDNDNYECYSIFYKILSEVKKYFIIGQNKKIIPSVVLAKQLIENNFRDNNFNIDRLVSTLSISASYLRREFKTAYGVSPIEYLKHVRLQNAILLLSADYYLVEELAEKCRTRNLVLYVPSWFAKLFAYQTISIDMPNGIQEFYVEKRLSFLLLE